MKNRVVVKSAFWYTASNILIKAINVITIPIFARILSLSEFGYYNNYTSWLAVMTVVVSLSLESTVVNAKKDFESDLNSYVFSMMILSISSGLLWLLIAILFSRFFESVFVLDKFYVICLFIYLIFLPTITLFQTEERFTYKYKNSVAISLIFSTAISLFSVVFAYVLTNKLTGVIVGRTIPPFIIGLFIVLKTYVNGARLNIKYWKYAIQIAWPYVPHLLAGTVLGAMNKIFITRICGSDANALYSLAYNCGLIISIFVTSLNSAYAPWLADNLRFHNYKSIKRVTRPYVSILGLLALFASLIAPEALLILGGKDYIEAMYVIPPISISCILQFVYGLYVNIEQLEKKTKKMAIATISAAVINIILNLILLPKFGYISAAYATALSYSWLLFIHMKLVFILGYRDVYDNRFNIIFVIVMSVVITLISFIYPYGSIRWALFVALLLACIYVLYKYKKDILAILQR